MRYNNKLYLAYLTQLLSGKCDLFRKCYCAEKKIGNIEIYSVNVLLLKKDLS